MNISLGISIRAKLLLSFIASALTIILALAISSYFSGRQLLYNAEVEKLSGIREIKTGQVIQYLDSLRDECLSTSESTMFSDAIMKFHTGFNALSATPEQLATYTTDLKLFYEKEFLPKLNQTAATPHTIAQFYPQDEHTVIAQALYLAENPYDLSKKQELQRAPDKSDYSETHAFYHPIFTRFAQRVGISDIYFIDIESGYVLYSVAKEVDFGSNLLTGPFKESGLAKAFIDIQRTNNQNFVKIIDFQFYDPSYGTPVGFIGTPVVQDGKKIGALIFKFPLHDINSIMTYDKQWKDAGLGVTGQSYIIGKDKLMRSISRGYTEDPTRYLEQLKKAGFSVDNIEKIQIYDTTVLLRYIDTPAAAAVVQGKTGIMEVIDKRSGEKLVAFKPINDKDVDWYMMVEINTSEAFAPITTLAIRMAILGFFALIIALLCALLAIRFITGPLRVISTILSKPTINLAESLPVLTHDEFGQLATAYNNLIGHISTMVRNIRTLENKLESVGTTLQSQGTEAQQETSELAGILAKTQEITKNMLTASTDLNTVYKGTTDITTQALALLETNRTTIDAAQTQLQKLTLDMQSLDESSISLSDIGTQTNQIEVASASMLTQLMHQIERITAVIQPPTNSKATSDTSIDAMRSLLTQEKTAELLRQVTTLKDTLAGLSAVRAQQNGAIAHLKANTQEYLRQLHAALQDLSATTTAYTQISKTLTTIQEARQKGKLATEQFTNDAKELTEQSFAMTKSVHTIDSILNDITTTNTTITDMINQLRTVIEQINV